MAIYEGSRYQKTKVFITDDVSYFAKRKYFDFNLEGSVIHTVSQGETLPGIAYTYYKKPYLWWVILDVNRATVAGVFNAVKPGTQLIIPTWESVMEGVPN